MQRSLENGTSLDDQFLPANTRDVSKIDADLLPPVFPERRAL